jgi:hypothetical protein
MGVLCGWASSSETGGKDGEKGDNTGREVRLGYYYNFNQNELIRFKDAYRAQIAAKAMLKICINNNIGYGQLDRTSLYSEAVRIGWNVDRIGEIKPCNTDCSETCAVCVNFAYKRALISSDAYTGSLADCCEDTGLFNVLSTFDCLKSGDMPIRAGHHVVMVLCGEGGFIKFTQALINAEVDGIVESETLSKLPLLKKGANGDTVAILQYRLNCYGANLTLDGSFGSATFKALCKFQKKYNLTIDGECGVESWRELMRG